MTPPFKMAPTFLPPWATCLLVYNLGVSAHMAMIDPAPINHPKNTFSTTADYDYINPLASNGANFPCKGQHVRLDGPEGQPVAEWQAGQTYSMTIDGGAFHSGGSCQASLSFDGGQTFKVIHSYVGSCPSAQGQTSYSLTLPDDTPSAERAIFAWTWFNNLGNREMYMNCASVSISGGRGGQLGGRPDIFVANVGNDCATVEARDVEFPNPGKDVSVQGSNTAPPTGACASGPGLGTPGDESSDGADGRRPGQSSPDDGSTPTEPPTTSDGSSAIKDQPTMSAQGPPYTHCRPVTNYVSGNDWPEWFNGADRVGPRVLNIVLLQLGLVGVHYAFRLWVL